MIKIKSKLSNVQSMENSDHYQRAINPSSLGEHCYTNEKIAAASLRACVRACLLACMCVSTNLGPETTSEKDFLLLGNNEGFCLSGKLLRLVGQCTVYITSLMIIAISPPYTAHYVNRPLEMNLNMKKKSTKNIRK